MFCEPQGAHRKGSGDAKGAFAPITPALASWGTVPSVWGYSPKELELGWKNQHQAPAARPSLAGEGEEPVIAGCKCLHWPGNCKLPLIAPNCWRWFSF